jgi:hypothetical protein
MSQSRTAAAAAVLSDGSLLMAGGTNASGEVLATVEIYATDGSFHPAAPMLTARTGHTATLLTDGRVLVTGGATNGGGIVNSAEIYDPATQAWTMLSSMMDARKGHTATALPSGDVLLAGGKDSSGTLASLEVFHMATAVFSPAGAMSSPRSGHAAAALTDGRVLLVGGTDANGATLVSTDLYDSPAGTVAPGPVLNTPRTAATATVLLNGTVLIAGGSYPEGAVGNGNLQELQTAEIFDALAGAITPLASNLNYARSGQLAFLLPNNNNVLLVGGTAAGADLASAELYASGAQTFSLTGSMATARSQAAGGALWPLSEGLLAVAGGSNSTSAELYGFPTIRTDQSDYAPGTPVEITGSGWQPGETVNLYLRELPIVDTPPVLNAIADQNGRISNSTFAPDNNDFGIDFYLTAVGSRSALQAQMKFADGLAPYISVNCVPGSLPVNNPTLCTVSVISHSTCVAANGTTIAWTSSAGGFSPATCTLSNLSCSVSFTPTSASNVSVTAEYPVTSGCASINDTAALSVQSTNPVPILNSLFPSSQNMNAGAFGLTVMGANFVTGSVVEFNGSARATTYVSPTQLTAAILSGDLANAGMFNVTVVNPSPGGGGSNTQTFTVNALTPTLTLNNLETSYDGNPHTCTGTATGVGGVTVAGSWSFNPASATSAGTYSLTGTFQSGNPNYASGGTATCTVEIDAKSVTASVTAANKSYDGTTTATITGCSLTGVVGSDNVTCSAAAASFASANAGTGITVTATGITLSGSAAANYVLSATSATTTADITGAAVAPVITAGNKTYDGAPTEPLSDITCTLTPAVNNLTCAVTAASFASANAGTGLTVTATGITLGGSAAPNYALSATTATTNANINPATPTLSLTCAEVPYDGNTHTCTGTATGLGGATVAGSWNFNPASETNPGSYTITGTFHSSDPNYTSGGTATGTLKIDPKSLTPSVTAANKSYDGATTATITGCSLTGVVGSDNVTCSAAAASFASANVGTGITVTATGITLSGSAAANYVLSATSATTTADITGAAVAPVITAGNKTYDGAPTEPLSDITCTLTPAVNNLTCAVTAASFASANAGTGLTVTATGITLGGSAAPNYALSATTATANANINPATPTLSLTCAEVPYDGNTHTCAGTATGVRGASVTGSWSFNPASETNPGSYTITGTFHSGDPNYTSGGTASGTLKIDPKSLTPSVTAANKNYDGTTIATLTGCTLAGVVGADNVSCSASAASFATANAGTGITVTATGITLGGSAASNYVLSATSAITTATINPAPVLTVTAGNASMIYGGAMPQFTCSITGALHGDTFTCSITPILNPTVPGSPYAIVPIASGTNLANYAVTAKNGQLTVSKASQTITCQSATLYYSANPIQPCSATSGLPVSYNAASGVAVLTPDGSGLLLSKLGTASLTATQNGNANYLPAPAVKSSFTVKAEVATISCTYTVNSTTPPTTGAGLPATAIYGDAPLGFVCGSNSTAPLTYTVSSPATLAGGILTIKNSGTVTVRVSQAASGIYAAAPSVTYTMQVSPAAANLSCTYTQNSTTPPTTGPGLPASVMYGNAPIPFVCSSTSTVRLGYTVTGPAKVANGILTITGAGAVSVKVTEAASTQFYAASPVTYTMAVTKAPLTITAPSYTWMYGTSAPDIDESCAVGTAGTELVNGDVAHPVPIATYPTTTSMPLGSYPVNCSVNTAVRPWSNYNITYVSGTLDYVINPTRIGQSMYSEDYDAQVGNSYGSNNWSWFTLTNNTGAEPVTFTIDPQSTVFFPLNSYVCQAGRDQNCGFMIYFVPQVANILYTETLTIRVTDAAGDSIPSRTILLHGESW